MSAEKAVNTEETSRLLRGYRSIFLSSEWVHQKYYGWSVCSEQDGLRVLRKRRGPTERRLLLLTKEGQSLVGDTVAQSTGNWSDIIVHDFDDCIATTRPTGCGRLRVAESGERLLNIATYVLDLSKDKDQLLSSMTGNYRRMIRAAEEAGTVVEAHVSPDEVLLDGFIAAYNGFAKERGIQEIRSSFIRQMYKRGDGVLFLLRQGSSISNYVHLYKTEDSGYYMYGVNLDKRNRGAGQYIQWYITDYLKRLGLRWYDLGGVTDESRTSGIHDFKRRFGGVYISLGTEYRCTGALYRLVESTASLIR